MLSFGQLKGEIFDSVRISYRNFVEAINEFEAAGYKLDLIPDLSLHIVIAFHSGSRNSAQLTCIIEYLEQRGYFKPENLKWRDPLTDSSAKDAALWMFNKHIIPPFFEDILQSRTPSIDRDNKAEIPQELVEDVDSLCLRKASISAEPTFSAGSYEDRADIINVTGTNAKLFS